MTYAEPQKQPPVVNRSAPKATVVPILIYEDVAKAISWLNGAFGFTERLRAAGREYHAPHPNEVNQYVHVHVEDVDRHFDHAEQFGARIVKRPTNMPFGERQYVAEDLAGHRWVFSQSFADVAPEKWGATTPQSRK